MTMNVIDVELEGLKIIEPQVFGECGLVFNDPALRMRWPEIDVEIKLSDKDRKHPPLAEIEPRQAI